MRKAAQKGFTNAMLALSENLAKKNTGESLREAASYVLNILHSEDSHMIYEANKLLEENAPLAAMVQQKTARTINRNSIFAELLSSITSKNEDPSPQRTM